MDLQLGQVSHIIVSSPEYAKQIMKTHDQNFANRPRILASDIFAYNCKNIFSPYGSYWRQLRKICILDLLSAKRVQTFRRIIEEEISALVRNISEHEGSVINLSQRISALTNSVVARAAFGRKTKNCLRRYFISIDNKVLTVIGRDHKNWNKPERFEPKRFLQTKVDYNFKGLNFEYIPFGAGRRMCPGTTFNLLHLFLELLLSNLLYHFDWKLPKGMKLEELDMDESSGATVKRKNDLNTVPVIYCS